MNVARVLCPVQVLGPGKRVGIWVAGCSRGCKGCSNPELWAQRPEFEISVDRLAALIGTLTREHEIDGFTISGGEPMNQAEELGQLIQHLSAVSHDVLVYTGYRIEELRVFHDSAIDSVLNQIAVLIDGEYIEGQNDNSFLRGSSNQRIHILNSAYEERYRRYLKEGHNQIQNFTTADGVVSVGIHHKSFSRE